MSEEELLVQTAATLLAGYLAAGFYRELNTEQLHEQAMKEAEMLIEKVLQRSEQ